MSPDLHIRFVEAPAIIRLQDPTARLQRRPGGSADPRSAEQQDADGGQVPAGAAGGEPGDSGPDGGGQPAADDESPAQDSAAEDQPGASASGPQASAPQWVHALNRFEELMRCIEAETDQLESRFLEDIRGLEPQVVRFALSVARKLVGHEVESGGLELSALVREGLEKVARGVRPGRRITIRVPTEFQEVIEEVLAERRQEHGRVDVEVVDGLPANSCEIDCDMRQVTIDLEREFRRLEGALLGEEDGDG